MSCPPKNGRLALGVDCGGTKSDAVLVDETGAVVGWGRGGCAHSLYVGELLAEQSYIAAIHAALQGHRPKALWIAGLIEPSFQKVGIQIPEAHFVHADEVTMGLAMALETHGVVVLAGTGAFVALRTENGDQYLLDGLGPLLGDHGSGYQIGLMGIRAAMASSWGPNRSTMLEQLVPKELGVGSLREMYRLAYIERIGRAEIASVAKAVIRAAEHGDNIAKDIILAAADDISAVLADLVHNARARESDYVMVASGGVAQQSRIYWSRVCEHAPEIAPRFRPVCPTIRPCVGAALLALREMGVPWSPALLARLEETQAAYLEGNDHTEIC